MKNKCPVCDEKCKNVLSHIRKMAMGEVYGLYLAERLLKGKRSKNIVKSIIRMPHQSYIEYNDTGKVEFSVKETA